MTENTDNLMFTLGERAQFEQRFYYADAKREVRQELVTLLGEATRVEAILSTENAHFIIRELAYQFAWESIVREHEGLPSAETFDIEEHRTAMREEVALLLPEAA